jgi:hypothetical protein
LPDGPEGLIGLSPAGVAAQAAPPPAPPCLVLFGHGRNFVEGEAEQNQRWDQINLSFARQAQAALEASGRRVRPVVLSVAATDLQGNLQLLMAEIEREGCTQVLETAVFAQPASQTVVARLRLYPVVGNKGPRVAGAPRLGSISYTNERNLELSKRSFERLGTGALGRAMAEEFLARE